MADIELVIKIPEETYEYWKEHKYEYVLTEAIANGTPLLKGHGDLIDRDRLTREEMIKHWYHLKNGDIACPKIDIDHAVPVIKADGGDVE